MQPGKRHKRIVSKLIGRSSACGTKQPPSLCGKVSDACDGIEKQCQRSVQINVPTPLKTHRERQVETWWIYKGLYSIAPPTIQWKSLFTYCFWKYRFYNPAPSHTHNSIQSRQSNFNQCWVRVWAVPSLWSRGVSSLLTESQQVSHQDFVTSGLTQGSTGRHSSLVFTKLIHW